jgi:hypothetical protein
MTTTSGDQPRHDWQDDEVLLHDLVAALRHADAAGQPLPDPRAEQMADAAWAWRDLDAELAALVHDSALEGASGMRAARVTTRTLMFMSGPHGVDIEVTDDALVGQLCPAEVGSVVLVTLAGEQAPVETDEYGSFVLDRPAEGGVLRLRCRSASGVLVTDWFVL